MSIYKVNNIYRICYIQGRSKHDRKNFKKYQAVVAGEIISDFEFSHEVFGEGFYFVKLKVSRLSHSSDIIPLLVSERLIDVSQSHIGQFLEARGQFRSYNKHENNRNHLVLSLFDKRTGINRLGRK